MSHLTPLMRQYLELKESYKDCLLFFRLGDFYELFFEDAKIASQALEIVLTGRDCGLNERAPMCGVPHHSMENYVNRLIEKGFKVAVCEQLSDPKQSKGLVERDVVRVITPGTLIEESMLEESQNNFLFSLFYQEGKGAGFSYADVSTGSYFLGDLQSERIEAQIIEELARVQPSEVLANEALFTKKSLIRNISSSYYLSQYADWAYEEGAARDRLLRHFNVHNLEGFGCENKRLGIRAAGALMAYLEDTQKNALSHITTIKPVNRSEFMVLDASTRRNLELTKPLQYGASKKNTLLHLLDKTKTAMGARKLRSWIEQPLQNRDIIESRLEAVAELRENVIKRDALRDALSDIYDIERLTSRISYRTVNARDCVALRISLARLPVIIGQLADTNSTVLKRLSSGIDPMDDMLTLLSRAIEDEPPVTIKEGGIIREGYNTEVDALRDAARNGRQWLMEMEQKERSATGIKNLRISYNKVFGYYLEVTKSYQQLVPYHYHRKQTLANAERYVTPALKELEEKILGATEQLSVLELKLFEEIRDTLLKQLKRFLQTASRIAALDAFCSLAQVASDNVYCRPTIVQNGHMCITQGRHPVVEHVTKDQFIPNDTFLDGEENRLIIITGPNMAGKSTYMRQIALITLMAHIGSFVPAQSADICIVDRICTRVGASDDLASGQSTFMVEMSEMANILHNATQKSLLILDEIGRGTSTFDGLSIAWAVLEHIASECKAKTLFATHYHELTALEDSMSCVKNYRTTVKEMGEDILFLHKVMRGGADKSFGIQVARLAGLPNAVVKRAKNILKQLERTDINKSIKKKGAAAEHQQLSLLEGERTSALLNELKHIDVDSYSPIEALNKLNELHQQAKRLISVEG